LGNDIIGSDTDVDGQAAMESALNVLADKLENAQKLAEEKKKLLQVKYLYYTQNYLSTIFTKYHLTETSSL
jgi:hypothetical protein